MLARAPMTGTNKLGLLLVLLDLAPEKISDDEPISKRKLAVRFLDLHWEHGRPYGQVTLRQSSSRKRRRDKTVADDTTVMQQVYELRELLKRQGNGELNDRSFEIVRHQVRNTEWHHEWDRALEAALANIEKDLWRNPVKRLQSLPGGPSPFLFSTQGDKIQFRENVAKELTKFSGVLRPLVEFRFAELVAKINRKNLTTDEYHIHEHLFDRERSMPPIAIRDGLIKLQAGRCIFTGSSLKPKSVSLDHVIPWSRTRLSLIENLVITTKRTNSSKSDSLLSPDLVYRWLNYIRDNSEGIEQLAEAHRWPADSNRVRNVALHMYEALDPATGVWYGKSEGVRPLGIDGKSSIIEKLKDQEDR